MTNLTKQHIGLQTIVTKSLNSKEKEVLTYISNPPTKFRDYELKDKQELGVYLLAIAKFIGIKEPLDDYQRKGLVKMLCEQFPTFNIKELDIALNMGVAGKFSNFDNQHYQSLSPMYISSIINEYKNYRGEVYNKYKRIKSNYERDLPTKTLTKKEQFVISLKLIENEYKDYIENPEEYKETEFRLTQYKHIYNFLVKYGAVKALKLEHIKSQEKLDKVYKSVTIKLFYMIHKENVSPTVYIKAILKKNKITL